MIFFNSSKFLIAASQTRSQNIYLKRPFSIVEIEMLLTSVKRKANDSSIKITARLSQMIIKKLRV